MRSTRTTSPLFADSIIDDEIRLEREAMASGQLRYWDSVNDAIKRGEGSQLRPVSLLMTRWFEPMIEAIRLEKREIRLGRAACKGSHLYGPILGTLAADRLAACTLSVVMNNLVACPAGLHFTVLADRVGRAVFAEINYDMMRAGDRGKPWDEKILRTLESRVRKLCPQTINWWANKHLDEPQHHRQTKLATGAYLLMAMYGVGILAGKDGEVKRGLEIFKKPVGKKKYRWVRATPAVYAIIEKGHDARKRLRPRYYPMLVQPYPWSNEEEGGYAYIHTPAISKPTQSQKLAFKAADMDPVFDCLNAVNATRWRVNQFTSGVMRELYDLGGGLAGVPLADDIPLPPRLEGECTPEAVAKNKAARAAVYRQNVHLCGDREMFLQKMDVISKVGDQEAFYMPHMMDFRGRMVVIPQYLNHHCDDSARGLLEFADAVEPDRRWLLIHAANCNGVDKVSFNDRVEWAEAMMGVFEGWVDRPLENTGWMEADKPWQALAAAHALVDENAGAHIPVQVDGSCNGLQHYAAIMLDADGGRLVNLLPSDSPQDVYATVGHATLAIVEREVQKGNEHAKAVIDLIDRKMVKQPVMTSVYGVTMRGAHDQVRGKLAEIGMEVPQLNDCARYLSRRVMSAICNVCVGAESAMKWLRAVGKMISNDGHAVAWTTPLGMPVVQPYVKRKSIRTRMAGVGSVLNATSTVGMPPSNRKQINGIAPNYIHSIDATHMMMTARACRDSDTAFAAVHDSYWTHAGTTDHLGRVLREQFVQLHSVNQLEVLHNELQSRHRNLALPAPPDRGDLDIARVLESEYFFN